MKSSGSVILALSDLQWLQRFAALLARDTDEADDLVQDTLVALWANPPRDTERPARPWLATVLRNLFRMQRRADTRRELREQIGSPHSGTRAEPERELARLEVLRILLAELDQLAPEDQQILIKRFLDGESAADIARLLKIPAATVRSRLHRSLHRLRGALDQRFKDRSTWSAAVLLKKETTAPPIAAAQSPDFSKGNTMSITAKAIFAATASALGVAGWFTLPDDPKPVLVATTAIEAAVNLSPSPSTPKAVWEQRRRSIRQALPPAVAAKPAPQVDGAAKRREHDEFRALVDACMDDIGSDASGAVTISMTNIGAPDVGTIHDEVELVEATFEDQEVLQCLIQSMYAWVGEAPAEPFERRSTWTFVLGEPKGDAKQQRSFDFIIGAHINEVRYCEKRGKPDADAVSGHASLLFALADDPDGHVRAKTPIVQSTDLSQEVVDCVINASQRWIFSDALKDKTFEYHFALPIGGRQPW